MPGLVAGEREQAITLPQRLGGLRGPRPAGCPRRSRAGCPRRNRTGPRRTSGRGHAENRIAEVDGNLHAPALGSRVGNGDQVVRPRGHHGQRVQVETDDGKEREERRGERERGASNALAKLVPQFNCRSNRVLQCGATGYARRAAPLPLLSSPFCLLSSLSCCRRHRRRAITRKRARAAGRIEQPLSRLALVAHLIEHVPGEPVRRVVLAQLMPQRPREKVLIERLEQVAVAVIRRWGPRRLIVRQCIRQPLDQPIDAFRTGRRVPGEWIIGQKLVDPPLPMPSGDERHQQCVIRLQSQ